MIEYLVTQGDITKDPSDAIVNSANRYLIKGSGICKKIYDGAGEANLDKCLLGKAIAEGECIVTSAFNLPAKYIFHILTPKYYIQNDKNVELLSLCYSAILAAANQYNCRSIAIPCIGVGHHGWPLDIASVIAMDTLGWVYNRLYSQSSIEKITFCCYTQQQYLAYKKLIASRKP